MQPTKTEAIKRFLLASTHSDLANLYNHDMEVQLIVGRDGGTRIDGEFKGKQFGAWSDGIQTWKPIRIPWNAMTEPTFEDSPITFDITSHGLGIGMTGWNWKDRCSLWVAFDFDALVGHSEKHKKKLSDEELAQIQHNISGVPWVTLRKSTSGSGLHLYIFTPSVATENHTVHAALAKAILAKLSGIVGYDFISKVDVCGGNMWIWHRKMAESKEGLVLLKQGTTIPMHEIPANWRDYIEIVSGKKKRLRPFFPGVSDTTYQEVELTFDEMVGQNIRVPLEVEHKRIIEWLTTNYPGVSWWDSDNHIMISHTYILQECYNTLELRGIFKTAAEGTERGSDYNCFLTPIKRGGWIVRRYTPGCAEDSSWEQDGQGWTKCFFNTLPTFHGACRFYGGIEDQKRVFHFATAIQAIKAAKATDTSIEIPEWAENRPARLKMSKDERLVIEIDSDISDNTGNQKRSIQDFLSEKNHYLKVCGQKISSPLEFETDIKVDEELRHVTTETGEDYGWLVKSDPNWTNEPFQHVKEYLKSRGHKSNDVSVILGKCVSRPWQLVNRPFQEEYLPNRQWNRNAAKIRYVPSQNLDNLKYPTWLKILNHCGKGLDDAIAKHDWCKANLVLTGADYLKIWISYLIRKPEEPLPYLFMYGPQDSGKSIFHEALNVLINNGVVRADNALINPSGFNGELENAVLCVIEETDLRRNVQAYNRIKDWVTSVHISIHRKSRTPYLVKNTCHFTQCSNTHLSCPVFTGDTRITMIYVDALTEEEKIPKRDIFPLLEKEAPDFLAEILSIELPMSNDRLAIPVIVTEQKLLAEKANQTLLEMFIEEKCFHVTGKIIEFAEFYDRFRESIDPNFLHEWSKPRIAREFPPTYPKGNSPLTNKVLIGNISWEPFKAGDPVLEKCYIKEGKMYRGKSAV